MPFFPIAFAHENDDGQREEDVEKQCLRWLLFSRSTAAATRPRVGLVGCPVKIIIGLDGKKTSLVFVYVVIAASLFCRNQDGEKFKLIIFSPIKSTNPTRALTLSIDVFNIISSHHKSPTRHPSPKIIFARKHTNIFFLPFAPFMLRLFGESLHFSLLSLSRLPPSPLIEGISLDAKSIKATVLCDRK